jgi:hypothetical protein
MDSPWIALLAFVLMLLAVGLGALIRKRWPEHHSNRETIELLQSTVLMLATFAAIVLGLLITSAKSDFDDLENDIRSLSSSIVQLDFSLELLGPEAIPARQALARYAAAGIAATWKDQAPPPGDYYPHLPKVRDMRFNQNSPVLGQMLEQVNGLIRQLPVQGPAAQRQLESTLRLMNVVLTERWRTVEASETSMSSPFFVVLVFWLVVIFLCFGLSAPFNHLSFMVTALSGLALASALFVIIDLYTPYTGIFTISSSSAREGLAEMLAEPDGTPPPWTSH